MSRRYTPCFLVIVVLFSCLAVTVEARSIVAVSTFANHTGNADLDVLGKGLQGMLTTDLVGIKSLEIVERERVRDLLKEIELGKSGYIDPATAQKLGKGVGAAYVLTGSYVLGGDTLRLDARLVEVESSKVVMAEKATGQKEDIFAITQKIVVKLTEALSLKLSRMEARTLKKERKASFEAFSLYSKSLNAVDQGKVEDAQKLLEQALKMNEDFDLALSELDAMERAADARLKRKYLPEELVKLIDAVDGGDKAACDLVMRKNGLFSSKVGRAGHALITGLGHPRKMSPLGKADRAMVKDYGKALGRQYALFSYARSKKLECVAHGMTAGEHISLLFLNNLNSMVQFLDFADTERRKNNKYGVIFRISIVPDILNAKGEVVVPQSRIRALFIRLGSDFLKRYPDSSYSTIFAQRIKGYIENERIRRDSK